MTERAAGSGPSGRVAAWQCRGPIRMLSAWSPRRRFEPAASTSQSVGRIPAGALPGFSCDTKSDQNFAPVPKVSIWVIKLNQGHYIAVPKECWRACVARPRLELSALMNDE